MLAPGWDGGFPQVNRFEQVSRFGHQTLLAVKRVGEKRREGGPCTVRSKLNKFEHVHGAGPGWGEGILCSEVRGSGPRGLSTLYSEVQWGLGLDWARGSLYSMFQCITANGPPERNDRHERKHYLPATSLAGGNESERERLKS